MSTIRPGRPPVSLPPKSETSIAERARVEGTPASVEVRSPNATAADDWLEPAGRAEVPATPALAVGAAVGADILASVAALSERLGPLPDGAEVAALGDVDIAYRADAPLRFDGDLVDLHRALQKAPDRAAREPLLEICDAVVLGMEREGRDAPVRLDAASAQGLVAEWREVGVGTHTEAVLRECVESAVQRGDHLSAEAVHDSVLRDCFAAVMRELDHEALRAQDVVPASVEQQLREQQASLRAMAKVPPHLHALLVRLLP